MLSRHTIRKTLKWVIAILLLAGAGAGGYGYWLWHHCDEYLLEILVRKQQELTPDWDVHIGRAHFDWYRRVHVYDVTIKAKGQKSPIVTLPEIVFAIDREKFQKEKQIEVESIHAINPLLEIRRDVQGNWDWKQLLTLKPSERSLPEWTIEQGTFRIRYDQPENSPPTEITLAHADLKLIPSGKRLFTFLGKADFNDAGTISVKGDWNVDAQTWTMNGQLSDIQHSGKLLQLAAGTSSTFRQKMAELDADLQRVRVALSTPEETRVAMRPDAAFPISRPAKKSPTNPLQLPDFGFESTVDLKFFVAQSAPRTEWQFRTVIDLKQGTLTHPVLPFPLRGLVGEVYWDNRQMEFRNVSAQNGITRLSLNGKLERGKTHASGRMNVELSNLLFDRRLRSRLPASLREQYDKLQPSGPADVHLTLHREAEGRWKPMDFALTAKGCGTIHQVFPYPVSDIVGTIKQRGSDLVVDLIGQAGGRKVEIRGEMKQPGPTAETWFNVRVQQFPLDDRFRQACVPEVRDVLKQMNLNGWADVFLSLYRPPGLGHPFQTKIDARLSNCEILLEAFPYRVTNLGGLVTYRSDQKHWKFEQIKGEHGTTSLAAVGEFRQAVAPGELLMTIATKGALLDESLYRALPDSVKRVWTDFSPGGKLDTVSTIRWVPNMGFEWSLPKAVIYDARMALKAFPFALTNVRAELSYVNETCEVQSFSAQHDDTRIRGKGSAFLPAQGRWVLNLMELFVDDLSPDRQFRQALPSGLRTVIEEFDPQNPFSFAGGVRLSGTERESDPIVAAWNLRFVFTGNQLNTGIPLKNVLGQITTRGTWDGHKADAEGQIQLESVQVMDYQLSKVQGPYRIKGNEVIVGSPKVFDPNQHQQGIPLTERLTAQAINGMLTYDAEVLLDKEVQYRSRLTLINGKLEDYARRYLPGTKNISGVVNGWLDLSGQGVDTNRMSGSGKIQISPAALYEMPIIAQIFQVLSLSSPDRTAFRFASVEFDISKSQFVFNAIDLVGESLSLRGRGIAGFDGRLKLDFYSMLPRARLPWPVANLVNPVLDQATKDWVRVEVRGKTSRPDVKMKPVPVVDDTIKGFLGILGNGIPNNFRSGTSGRSR
ncbi:MAG: hypothetical protein KDA84_11900 [Planctomycetaceae bacterium]|nr:hypothetical protein [Planctomycetaceae bacterium]